MVVQVDRRQPQRVHPSLLAGSRARETREPGLDEVPQALAGAAPELRLPVAPEDEEAEAQDGVSQRGARVRPRTELDRARVGPLPDLEVPPALLHVALEGHVAPAPDARIAARHVPDLVGDAVDAHAAVEAERPQPELEQHHAPLERLRRVVERPDDGGIREGVVVDETARDLPGAAVLRRAGPLGRQHPAALVVMPAALLRAAVELRRVEVERGGVSTGERRVPVGVTEEPDVDHAAGGSTRRVSISIPPARRPPASSTTRSRKDVHMWSWISFAMRRCW